MGAEDAGIEGKGGCGEVSRGGGVEFMAMVWKEEVNGHVTAKTRLVPPP